MYREVRWYETTKQKRDRINRERRKLEKKLENETPEEREKRLKRIEQNRANAQKRKARPEPDEAKIKRLEKYRRRLRQRHKLRYNCESLEQYGKRLKRCRNRMSRRPKSLKLDGEDDKKKTQTQKKTKIIIKKEPGVEEDENLVDDDESYDSDETPEEFIERKIFTFKCMQIELEIAKAKTDLKKEERRREILLEQLNLMRERAKELQDYFGLPLVSKFSY